MKKLLYLAAVCAALISCNKQEPTTSITFSIYPDMIITTRATPTEAALTDIWIYEGNTLVKHQTSTDADFGTPTVSLTYGSHDLTFVAANGDNPTTSTGLITFGKPRECFAKQQTFAVTPGTNSYSVTLPRIVSRLSLLIDDIIPQDAHTIRFVFSRSVSVDLSTALGSTPGTMQADVVVTGNRGNANCVCNAYTICHTMDEYTTDLTIYALREDGSVLSTIPLTNVPLKANRTTQIQGTVFDKSGMSFISVQTAWDDPHTISL